jgi:hypothetical protein
MSRCKLLDRCRLGEVSPLATLAMAIAYLIDILLPG